MDFVLQFVGANWENLLAFLWFMICFKGYIYYSRKRSFDTACLASLMHLYRKEWMLRMLERDVRIPDTTVVANLERSVSFFASTTMLVLAGLVTVLGSTEQAINVIADLPLVEGATRQEWEVKLLVMISLFTYAFFKFTWGLRQYGFASVMIGGAPQPNAFSSELHKNSYAERIASMTSMAANNFNYGLRSYYFGLAMLGWIINPWLFMALSAGVVYVLYRREFKSATLDVLMMSVEKDNDPS